MKMGVGVPHRENYQWNTSCDYSIKVQGKDICVKDQGSKDAAEKNIGIFYISNDLLMAWTYYETKNYLKLQNKDLSPYDSISFPSTKMQRHVASRGALKDQPPTIFHSQPLHFMGNQQQQVDLYRCVVYI
jgi:hypothetical protein